MNRYIADLHFGHKNILEFDRRPYSSIEEHVRATPEYYRLLEAMKIAGTKNAYNVGCMMEYMDYTPRTLEEILNY